VHCELNSDHGLDYDFFSFIPLIGNQARQHGRKLLIFLKMKIKKIFNTLGSPVHPGSGDRAALMQVARYWIKWENILFFHTCRELILLNVSCTGGMWHPGCRGNTPWGFC
jgi:hypothetical protein